jgi:diphthine methyl ester synthase
VLTRLVVCSCDKVFLEAYTSILGVDKEKLEALYGRPVIEADRDLVEQGADTILEPARTGNVAFLVVGDVFGYVLDRGCIALHCIGVS